MNQNKVASILKVYGIINGIAGIILTFIIGDETSEYIAIGFAAAAIVVSFAIYAFGEVVEILHDIRENTKVEKDILSAVQERRNSAAFSHHNGGETVGRNQTAATSAKITEENTFAQRYEEAMHLLETEEYKRAEEAFSQLGDFRDSKTRAAEAWKAQQEKVAAEEERKADLREKAKAGNFDLSLLIEQCENYDSAKDILQYLDQLDGDHPALIKAREIAKKYANLERVYGKMPTSVIITKLKEYQAEEM